jgi:hypothetical protein
MPVLLMIHEFEEIFMIEVWYLRNKEKIKSVWPKRKPFGLDNAGQYLTPSISIGIFCQFIVIVLICLLCAVFKNYYAWYGFGVGFVLNTFLLHLRDVIKFKGYTPGIITSVIISIPCIGILYQTATILDYGWLEIILSTVLMNVIGGFLVFRLLHKAMVSFSKWLIKYSKVEAGA